MPVPSIVFGPLAPSVALVPPVAWVPSVLLGAFVLLFPLLVLAWAARRVLGRWLVIALLGCVYRLRAFGRENVPVDRGAVLVPNHVSMIDGLWVGAVLPRLVYFLMHRDFATTPVIGPFALMMGTIPVATGDTPEAKAESLRRAGDRVASGDLVCIFAEGVITRSGALMPFMKGLEAIAGSGGVEIVPVALDRVWGSLFSFSGGKFLWKLPRRWPYPIDVVFGAPLPSDTPAWRVRDAVAELLARRREERASELHPLGYRFARSARQHARRGAVIDAGGRRTSYARLLRDVLALQSAWQRSRASRGATPGARIATLLPLGRGSCALHVVLAMEREIALPLESRASDAELVEQCASQHVTCVVLDRATCARRSDWVAALRARGTSVVALEDLEDGVGLFDRVFQGVLALLPGPILARSVDPMNEHADARAPVVVSSVRREGTWRGVVLSQANVISNARSLAETFDIGEDDRILATLEYDDPLGYLAGLWLPLVCGATLVVPDSFEGREIAAACRRERVTILPLTPAQVSALIESADPADLASVRSAFCDGSRVGSETFDRWRARFTTPLYAGWGLPELSPVASISLQDIESGHWHHTGSKPRAVGRALSGVALRVVARRDGEGSATNEHRAALPPGNVGVLEVRGPGVMLGYLDDPEATERAVREGWFLTDLEAEIDKDGFLFLAGRESPSHAPRGVAGDAIG